MMLAIQEFKMMNLNAKSNELAKILITFYELYSELNTFTPKTPTISSHNLSIKDRMTAKVETN